MDTHHSQVIVRLSSTAMLQNGTSQCLDDLTGVIEMSLAKDMEQMVVAKLNELAVLGLVQSVSIDKQRMVLDTLYLLANKLKIGPETNWRIGLHIEEVAVIGITTDDGRIMTSIAEREMARREINQSKEECHEHAAIVVISYQRIVHAGAYLSGLHAL